MLSRQCWDVVRDDFGRPQCVARLRKKSSASFLAVFDFNLRWFECLNQDLSVYDGCLCVALFFQFNWTPASSFVVQCAFATVIVLKLSLSSAWWPMINSMSKRWTLVEEKGSCDFLLILLNEDLKPVWSVSLNVPPFVFYASFGSKVGVLLRVLRGCWLFRLMVVFWLYKILRLGGLIMG